MAVTQKLISSRSPFRVSLQLVSSHKDRPCEITTSQNSTVLEETGLSALSA
jgi:hypothetical protein